MGIDLEPKSGATMCLSMAQHKTLPKPTLADLRAAGKIDLQYLERMQELAVRLIQIGQERKALDEEYGYKDSQDVRHPGLSDELERLVILNDLGGTGFKLENYSVIIVPGSRSTIDGGLLLAEGVDPAIIARCTVTTTWAGLQVRRDPGT